jgi:hypothetical protein
MAAEPIVFNFHAAILTLAAERLRRLLSEKERASVTRREGLVVLESIHDYVSTLPGLQLEQYLNAE